MRAVTKAVLAEAGESCLTRKVRVHHVLDLVPDQSPEVALEVLRDRVHDRSLDLNLGPCLVHDPGLVQVRNRGVSRDRKARRDQDPAQQRAARVRGQDQAQERVNRDRDRAVARGKAEDHSQDQDLVLQQVHDQDQDPQLAHDQDQDPHPRLVHGQDPRPRLVHDQDRVLQLVHGRNRDHLVVREKQSRDQGQDPDQEVVRNQRDVNREAKADRNLNQRQGPDRVLVRGQRVDLEVAVLADRQGKREMLNSTHPLGKYSSHDITRPYIATILFSRSATPESRKSVSGSDVGSRHSSTDRGGGSESE